MQHRRRWKPSDVSVSNRGSPGRLGPAVGAIGAGPAVGQHWDQGGNRKRDDFVDAGAKANHRAIEAGDEVAVTRRGGRVFEDAGLFNGAAHFAHADDFAHVMMPRPSFSGPAQPVGQKGGNGSDAKGREIYIFSV